MDSRNACDSQGDVKAFSRNSYVEVDFILESEFKTVYLKKNIEYSFFRKWTFFGNCVW